MTLGNRVLLIGLGALGGSAGTFFYKNSLSAQQEDLPPNSLKIDFLKPRRNELNYETYFPNKSWDFNWDSRHHLYSRQKRNSDENEVEPSRAVRHIILIRHGQYNLKGTTDQERTLSELGMEQARLTGKRLSELNIPLTSILSSTMTRAIQTCDAIQESLPPDLPLLKPDSLLNEGGPYPPEPIGSWSPEFRYHVDGARIEAAFRRHFHRAEAPQTGDSYEVVVCHANVIRYFACRALQLPPEAWLRISLKHGSITWITIRPSGRVTLRSLGDAGHLPPHMLTTS